MMELTNELLQVYVGGGQLEIQNPQEKYLFRGEVESVTIKSEGDNKTLKVRFVWLAKSKKFPPTGEWVKDDNLDYEASLINVGVSVIGIDKILLKIPIKGELCLFLPPNGSKLDPAKVEGLDLSAVT
jgi:hypothetical protein